MIVDLPRRWRWVVAAACALIAVLAVVFVWSTRSAERRAAIVTPVVPVLASATVELPVEGASAVAAAVAASAPRGVDQVEVCGAGWVAVEPDGTPDGAALEAATGLNAALESVLGRMRGANDELTRATAILLGSNNQLGWLERLFGNGAENARDALARIATTTTDPEVYGLAFRQCDKQGASVDNTCRMLSAPRWSQLDPLNARPWFYILEAARARNDPAGEAEALHRIASSARDDSGFLATTRAILGVLPDDDGDLLAGRALIVAAIGIEAATPSAGMQALLASCQGNALADANRSQTCAAIADLLLDRSDTLMGRGMAMALGRRVGWPADRIDAARGQMTGYYSAMATNFAEEGSLACPAVRHTLQRLRDRSTIGEAATLRAWIAQSGKTDADFIAIGQAQRAARAQAPASAASGP